MIFEWKNRFASAHLSGDFGSFKPGFIEGGTVEVEINVFVVVSVVIGPYAVVSGGVVSDDLPSVETVGLEPSANLCVVSGNRSDVSGGVGTDVSHVGSVDVMVVENAVR